MKSILVKELKKMGYRRINGKKLENYSFYTLVGMYTQILKGQNIK